MNGTLLLKKYVSGLLSGEGPDRGMFEKEPGFPHVVRALADNEILYHTLMADGAGNDDPRVSVLLREQKELAAGNIGYYCEIAEAFEKKGLRAFPMKSFRSYDYADKDLDIVLVDRDRKDEYLETLEGLGFGYMWNRSVLREPYKRFYVRKDAGDGECLPHIHVHFAVSWNGIEFIDAGDVWKRMGKMTVSGREITVPSPEDEILIMAAHSIHENGYVTAGEMLHLRNIIHGTGRIDTGYLIRCAKERNWYKGLKSFLAFTGAYYKSLTGKDLFPGYFSDAMEGLDGAVPGDGKSGPPYFFPAGTLIAAYADKGVKDICSGRLLALPREMFTFGLVIWLFRNKKRAKFHGRSML